MQIDLNAANYIDQQKQDRVVEPISVSQPEQIDRKAQAAARRANQGRFAWSKKHGYLGCDSQWHELWVMFIPSFGCDCKEDFNTYCKANPPDFSSPEAYFIWGFNLHNYVNRKLSKPELTIAEAQAIWRQQDGRNTKQSERVG